MRPLAPDLDVLSDGDLARRVAGGDPEAEVGFVRRMARRVFLYGMRHLRDETSAHDLAQDVLATVLVRLRAGEVREPDHVGAFVLGTARNLVHDARRRERRRDDLVDRLRHEPPPWQGGGPVLDRDRLRDCLERLPERERAVVVLTFAGDRDGAEIADALGTSPGNVRVIRHRAVALLRSCMGAEAEVPS